MRNLKVYSDDAFTFHMHVVDHKRNRKDDVHYKERLVSYNDKIKRQYDSYDENYNGRSLENITGLDLSANEKNDLLGLYSYKSKAIQELKIRLTTSENNRVINTCQSCTVGEVNSLDHILPKDVFSEFSVNPKNLFPSCTKCNSFKVNSWLEGNQRIFLNLFCDELPNEQYLFVDTQITEDNIQASFIIDNKYGIHPNVYNLIASHYRRLYLCERFAENSSEVITSLDNSIMPYTKMVSAADIIGATKEKIAKDRATFGYNYWKSLLELSLIDNKDYLSRIFQN